MLFCVIIVPHSEKLFLKQGEWPEDYCDWYCQMFTNLSIPARNSTPRQQTTAMATETLMRRGARSRYDQVGQNQQTPYHKNGRNAKFVCVRWQDYIVQDLSDSLRILPSRAVYRSRWRVVYADLPQLCLFLNILFQLPSSKARPAAHKLCPIQSQREVLVGLIVMSSAWFPFRKIETHIE